MKNSEPKMPKLQAGFTLLELMIVMFIIVILATIALPLYQKTVEHTRETVLQDNLYQMRKIIDQYAADKGKPPESPEDLVSAGYIRDIPKDPMTDNTEWDWKIGEGVIKGKSGIVDVHSLSQDTTSDGKRYSEF